MSKNFPSIAASIALGAVLVGASAQAAPASSASTSAAVPEDGWCFYNAWHCSYVNGGYWSGCQPGGAPGVISTKMARTICEEYHSEA